MGMTVEISSSLEQRIVSDAARSRDEICGLLLGHDGDASRIDAHRACRNVAPDPGRHFEIDPAALIAAHRAMRTGGPAIIGYYHSHPSGDARPSVTDAAQAAPDGAIWLITDGAIVTAWRAVRDGAVHGRFDPVELVVIPACA